MTNKRGELDLSFGMIFSIILIISFLAFGFYGIKALLNLQKQAQLNLFIQDITGDVDELWQSATVNDWEREYNVPSNVEEICFKETEFNFEIKFKEDPSIIKKISHLNINKMLEQEDPFCVKSVKSKINLVISLEEGESLIVIKK